MKQFLLLCIIIIGIVSPVYGEYPLFNNDKLLIIDDTIENNRLSKAHIAFYNRTNNNMRVTFVISGLLCNVVNGNHIDFTKRKTIYIKPQGVETYFGVDPGDNDDDVMNFYIREADKYNLLEDKFMLTISKFELINYGVEQKNYETQY